MTVNSWDNHLLKWFVSCFVIVRLCGLYGCLTLILSFCVVMSVVSYPCYLSGFLVQKGVFSAHHCFPTFSTYSPGGPKEGFWCPSAQPGCQEKPGAWLLWEGFG